MSDKASILGPLPALLDTGYPLGPHGRKADPLPDSGEGLGSVFPWGQVGCLARQVILVTHLLYVHK